MKITTVHRTTKLFALVTILSLISVLSYSQNFQNLYGTSLDNSFSKVIKDGSNYYVLGQDEFTDGTPPSATVTRLDANGIHQWTLSLNISSVWNDAVLTPSGDLLVVGSTLPFDATCKSLMGLVTPNGGGGFTWVRTYDVPGRESNTRIVRSPSPQNPAFPYYVIGTQFDPNGNATWDDIILLNINEAGTFNWKKIFPSVDDDEFARNLDVMSNGDLILSGNKDNLGVILRLDNSGALIAGGAPDAVQFSFADVTPISGGGFYAVGGTFPSFTAHLFKFDQDLIPVWSSTISGLTSVSQVWEESSSGVIYVVGSGVFNGINRGVVLLFVVFGQTPILQWVKYLDNNESTYVGGSITLLSANEFAFVDGRSPTAGGFGQQDALMSVNDLQFATCITDEDFVNTNSVTLTYIAPFLEDIEFFDFPTGTNIVSAALNWQQEDACNISPCNADFIITPIGSCGQYQVTNTSTGALPLTYTWCDGSTSQDLNVTLPCGPHTFCLTITDANGCTSSYSESVNVTDLILPTPVCVPGFGVTLDAACQALIIPSMIDGGSTDNCQVQSLSTSPAILTGCGLFPVTLTVTDWCGNTNVCVTNVQTNENVPPVIVCPPNKTLTTGASNCTLVVNGLHWLSITDNCSTSSFTVNYTVTGATTHTGTGDASGLTFNQGTSIVTYTAFDDCGNSSSCSFSVRLDCVCNCVNNKLLNPGFYEGAVAGNLGTTGHSDHWLEYATPQVVPGDSCCDDVSIQMFGWLYNGEAMYQQGMNFLAGHHYKISFCARFVPNGSYGNNVSFGFSAANGYVLPFQCTICATIGNSPQIFSSSWVSYTLPIWTPTQNWDRFYVRTFNTLAQKAWGRIDNICIQEVGQTCCADRDAFVANINNAVQITIDAQTDEVVFSIGNLPECDSIAYIDWGDGNVTQGPFGGNTERRNRFLDHLLAKVQYQANEYNLEEVTHPICFETIQSDSVEAYQPSTKYLFRQKKCGKSGEQQKKMDWATRIVCQDKGGRSEVELSRYHIQMALLYPIVYPTPIVKLQDELGLPIVTQAGEEINLFPNEVVTSKIELMSPAPAGYAWYGLQSNLLTPTAHDTVDSLSLPVTFTWLDLPPGSTDSTGVIWVSDDKDDLYGEYILDGYTDFDTAVTTHSTIYGLRPKIVCKLTHKYTEPESWTLYWKWCDVWWDFGGRGTEVTPYHLQTAILKATILPEPDIELTDSLYNPLVNQAGEEVILNYDAGVTAKIQRLYPAPSGYEWYGLQSNPLSPTTSTEPDSLFYLIKFTWLNYPMGSEDSTGAFWISDDKDDLYGEFITDGFSLLGKAVLDTTTSIHSDLVEKIIRISPNPTNGYLTIELPSTAVNDLMIRIVSITGQAVMEKRGEVRNTIQSIAVNSLVSGMYFVQILSDGRVMSVKRFVKE